MRSTLLIVVFLLTACHPPTCDWNSDYEFVLERPNSDKLLGHYMLGLSSQEFLNSNFSEWPMFLKISKDGQYSFYNKKNLPVKGGNWLLTCDGKSECLMELEGITVEPLGLKETDLAILVALGDGNHCEGIVYEKVK